MSIIAASSLRVRFRRLTPLDRERRGRRGRRVRPDRADHGRHVHRRVRAEPGHHRRPSRHAGGDRYGGSVARFTPPPRRRQRHLPDGRSTDIMKVGGYILSPLQRKSIEDRAAQAFLLTHQCNQHQQAVCTYTGAGNSLSCSCTNTTVSLPASMVTDAGQRSSGSDLQLQASGVRLLHEVDGNGGGPAGTHLMKETAILKPRSQNINLLQTSNTPCPAPTY